MVVKYTGMPTPYQLQFLYQARDGTLAVEDMDGGTFTISNGGVFGSLYGTPIINPPQSAILGMHGVFDRPVAINKQVSTKKRVVDTDCICYFGWGGGGGGVLIRMKLACSRW